MPTPHNAATRPSGRATFTYYYHRICIPVHVYRGYRPSHRHAEYTLYHVCVCVCVCTYSSSSSERAARFDSALRRTHTHTHEMCPSSVVKFKTLPLGPSLRSTARICHDRRDKSPRLFFNPLPPDMYSPPTLVCVDIVRIHVAGRFKNPRYPRGRSFIRFPNIRRNRCHAYIS